MGSIIDTVYAMVEYFEVGHGVRPNTLYVGFEDYVIIRNEAGQHRNIKQTGDIEFMGMQLIGVSKKHHLDVSFIE